MIDHLILGFALENEMDLSVIFCGVGFSIWFLVTILYQFPRTRITSFLSRYDFFSVIPTWTFFAPNPAVQDFTLLYRDKDCNGTKTPWMVFNYRPSRPEIRWLWNPAKRRSKVIHDMASLWLAIAGRDASSREYLVSVPYLCLLQQVSAVPRGDSTIATQIAIASVFSRHRELPALLLIESPFHRL